MELISGTRLINSTILLASFITLVSGCSKPEENAKKAPVPLVSVTQAQVLRLEIREQSIGTLEGLMDPTIAAEVPARVVRIMARPGQIVKKGEVIALLDPQDYNLQKVEAESEVARLSALLLNQQRNVERNEKLVEKNFISQNALDDIQTQQIALKRQLEGARSRLASIEHNSSKTRLISPIDGKVEKQIVSPGDYVKVGDPLLQVISNQRLRAHLPFPESLASKFKPGLKVRLKTPTSDEEVNGVLREFKPVIASNNRAVDVLVDIEDQPGWQSGASVTGNIILGEFPDAVVVPEQSVVLRPAGEVVYVIENDMAQQRIVKTGLFQDGKIQITSGLSAGETVAVDGAAFLTDQAKVSVQPQRATP
ncbi:efflux RND transporter periplasmic adaptor subunit [Methylobacillus gramineus]|uniref:efflux RND transporter periplasmic adaptor subunit n=1 Tax=Methylobacillus gramineus TaxID=755169 RepID=UPI001CFF8D88|nr:efflux RND transporter periplasmic adaptor subunit [Methylobacillus gramineus]MCB5185594.1 efflux RND transporter periplasmic adaptor subunit [Methylobacillus gramineus]